MHGPSSTSKGRTHGAGGVARRIDGQAVALWVAIAPVLAAFVAACTVASHLEETLPPNADATPSRQGETFVAEADGYTLTVTADRAVVAPGDTVTFTSSFHNGTGDPIDLAGQGCAAAGTIMVEVPMPTGPTGRSWSGLASEFKEYVLTQGMGPGIVPALDPLLVFAREMPCADGDFGGILESGGTVTATSKWRAEIAGGVAALPGDIPFTATAGYDQQNEAPSYAPDYTGIHGSWAPMFKRLAARGQLEVRGEAPTVKGPGEAIDALLGDPTFAAWLDEHPSTTWSNANLFLVSYAKAEGIVPAGPSWEIELFREIDVPRHWAIAFVDAFDGSLRSVTYCDIPCDR